MTSTVGIKPQENGYVGTSETSLQIFNQSLASSSLDSKVVPPSLSILKNPTVGTFNITRSNMDSFPF
jgi:hypothetical protein